MRIRVGVLTPVLAACVGAGLAGCTADPQPASLPRLTAAAAVGPGAGAGSVAPPAEAAPETATGAAAFVRYYFEQLNAAYLSLDLHVVAGLVLPQCRSCANFEGDIRAMRAHGHRLVGDSFQVVSADAPPLENRVAVVNLLFRSPGPVEYQSSGQVLLHRPATAGQAYVVTVVRVDGRWRIREVQLP